MLSDLNAVLQSGKVQLWHHVVGALRSTGSPAATVDVAAAFLGDGRGSRGGNNAAANAPPNPDLLPRYRAVAYGSFVSGLCSPHGDIDVAVELDPDWPHLPFSQQVQTAKTLKHLLREDKAELLTRLVKELGRAGVLAGRPQLVLRARVPIAKAVHARTGIKCDLSVGGRDSSWKSSAVGEAVRAAGPSTSGPGPGSSAAATQGEAPPPRGEATAAAALVRLAKAWARHARLADAASSGLNSFSLTLLALFHMQMSEGVPPLRELMGLEKVEAEAEEEEGEEEEEVDEKEEKEGKKVEKRMSGGSSGSGDGDGGKSYNTVVDHLLLPLEQRRPLTGGVLQDHAEKAMEALRRNTAAHRAGTAAAAAAPTAAAGTAASSTSSSSPIFGFLFPSQSPPPPPSPSLSATATVYSSEPDLVSLLAQFLAGLSSAMARWRASPRARARVRASVWHGRFSPGVWGKGYAAGVEDPFDWSDNCAMALGVRQRDRVAEVARRCSGALLAVEPSDGGAPGGGSGGGEAKGAGDGSGGGPDARGVFRQLFGANALSLVQEGQGGGGGGGGGGSGGSKERQAAAPLRTAAPAVPTPTPTPQRQQQLEQQQQQQYQQQKSVLAPQRAVQQQPPPRAPPKQRRQGFSTPPGLATTPAAKTQQPPPETQPKQEQQSKSKQPPQKQQPPLPKQQQQQPNQEQQE